MRSTRFNNSTNASSRRSTTSTSSTNSASNVETANAVDNNTERPERREGGNVGMDDTPAFTSADFQREFTISVPRLPGQSTTTPKPQLLDDWKSATLDAAAKERGKDELQPKVDAAIADAEKQVGRPLERREMAQVANAIYKTDLPPLRGKHYGDIIATDATKQDAIDQSLSRHGLRMQNARDPFMPLALGDPQARAKDRVLWEDSKVMVLVDSFSPKPKALVVPKTPTMFPTDMDAKDLDHIADIAQKVSDAFGKLTGAEASDIWINPPQVLTVKQLHCHVLPPNLPAWENPGPGQPGGRRRDEPVPAHVTAAQDKFYTAFEQELAQAL